MDSIDKKILLLIGSMGVIIVVLLVLVVVLMINLKKTRKNNRICHKDDTVETDMPENMPQQNVSVGITAEPETEQIKGEEAELTVRPQYNDDIENYVIKTAEGLGLHIGKIHSMGRRDNQQDSFAYSDVENEAVIKEKGILLIVADGMGGLANGAEVSSLIAVSMLQYFDHFMKGDNMAEELKNMVLYANDEVNKYLGEEQLGKCGSTLVATLVKNHQIYWISVGDSSIFLCHDSHIERINPLHNYAQDLKEMVLRGEISEEEAATHPKRATLTSFIGAGTITHISQNEEPIMLSSGDRLILASDGVFGTVSTEEMEDMMHYDVEEAALKLKYLIESKNKRKQDNYTAIIMEENF